jgi:hypothetical protein
MDWRYLWKFQDLLSLSKKSKLNKGGNRSGKRYCEAFLTISSNSILSEMPQEEILSMLVVGCY